MTTRWAMVGALNDRHMEPRPDGDYVKWSDVAPATGPGTYPDGSPFVHGDWCEQTIRPTEDDDTDSTFVHNSRCRDSRRVEPIA